MLALLRVAVGGCAPPIPSVARQGEGIVGSGRESRPADRTGKRQWRRRMPHGVASLRVEGDGCDRRPVAGWSAPAPRVALARPLIQGVARGEHGPVLAGVALRRRDVADAAVAYPSGKGRGGVAGQAACAVSLSCLRQFQGSSSCSLEAGGECQRSCRLPFVTISPILRLGPSVPRCSPRGRSGARHPRHARAEAGAARGSGWLRASHPLRCAPRRGVARSGRESRRPDRTGKRDGWGCRPDGAVAEVGQLNATSRSWGPDFIKLSAP